MAKIQEMNQIEEFFNNELNTNIRGYTTSDGTVYVNLQDVYVGLGFTTTNPTVATCGNWYISPIIWNSATNGRKSILQWAIDTESGETRSKEFPIQFNRIPYLTHIIYSSDSIAAYSCNRNCQGVSAVRFYAIKTGSVITATASYIVFAIGS
jgi:hypothetical protein